MAIMSTGDGLGFLDALAPILGTVIKTGVEFGAGVWSAKTQAKAAEESLEQQMALLDKKAELQSRLAYESALYDQALSVQQPASTGLDSTTLMLAGVGLLAAFMFMRR